MDFKLYSCPVCSENFKDEDDVVVCPSCGTAHHRECWNKAGKCANEERHGEEDLFLNINHMAEEPEHPDFYEQEEKYNAYKEEIDSLLAEEKPQEAQKVLLFGEPVENYSAALGKNSSYYLVRFSMMEKRGLKAPWNGIAFFAPLAWSVYRKMYKLAALVFALYVLLFGALSFSIFQSGELIEATAACVEEDPGYYGKILSYMKGDESVVLTPAQTRLMEITESIELPLWVQVLDYAIIFGVRIFMGLRATALYRKKTELRIKAARKKGLEEEKLRLFLARKYGTLPVILAAIVGFFEIQLFLM